MFFQSPRPFGQHSTSYRSMSNNMHSSSSMTNLKIPEAKSGRISVPPISFASIYEKSRSLALEPSVDHASISNTNFEQARISRESGLNEIIRNVEDDRPNIVRSAETSIMVPKNYAKHKPTSVQNSTDSGGTSDQNLNISQKEVHTPITKSSVFQVQRQNVSQQLPHWVCETESREPQPEWILQNVAVQKSKKYCQSVISDQDSPVSTVPFAEHIPKPAVIQPQPISIFSTDGYANMHPTHERGGFSEARIRSTAQFNASQIPFNEQQQKPIIYQQLERRKNYATLHHIVSPKMVPLQRRTSDSNLMRMNGSNVPANIAMFNVAKGVRAELEHDPKFRKRANILGSRTTVEPATATFCPVSLLKEQPKQSRSLREMESFFEHNVQQFHDMLDTKDSSSSALSSAKPFNVEHVRSIFQINNAFRTDSSPMTIPTSVDTQIKQDKPFLGKPIKSLVEHEAQEKVPHAKLKEDVRTFGFFNRHISSTSQSAESEGSTRELVEQKACSSTETNRENIQAKSAAFFINKPLIIADADKSPEMQKEIAILQGQPIVSQDMVILGKSRRLNYPFPVDDASSFTSDNEKSRNVGPAGILMKDGNSIRSLNDSGIKTQKKVAFQCDRNSIGFKKNEPEGSKTSAGIPPSVVKYDDAVEEPLQRLLKLSADIGDDMKAVGNKLSALFTEQRNFIWLAAGQNEPSVKELQTKLSPLIKLMEDLSVFKESKRNTSFFNHISAASEGIQALGWLTVKPTPAPFIKDMIEASMFFVNRVLKEHKDNKIHTEWAKSWSDLLNALQEYVRQIHTTGLVWNSCPGTKPPALVKQVSSSSFSSGVAPPPPPPPVLSPDIFAAVSSKTNISTDRTDRTALFAEINAGEEITKRLKKVTPDMQTHKNPALRSQAQHKEVDAGTGARETALAVSGGAALVKKEEDKPSKTWLNNGKQWNVEYYKNDNNVMVEVGNIKQTVYIFKCENSVIQIKGKVNSITLDSCKKTSVVFDSLLSQLEVINCQSLQIQTLGAMPTLSIQKTDGCQVYLSKSAINAEIITSKSSEMNVLVPGAEDGDFVEFAVPEQFKTVYDGKKLKTTVSDIC